MPCSTWTITDNNCPRTLQASSEQYISHCPRSRAIQLNTSSLNWIRAGAEKSLLDSIYLNMLISLGRAIQVKIFYGAGRVTNGPNPMKRESFWIAKLNCYVPHGLKLREES